MESRIPVPTDNVYKFYALFSLLVLVFSMGAILYVNQSTNNLLLSSSVELATLKVLPGQPPALVAAKKTVIEKRAALAVADKDFFVVALGGFSAIAICGLYYGFQKWHRDIQPVIDETAILQLEIAKLQLEKLRREHIAPPAGEEGAPTP